jgi:hypothetical protein
MLINKTVITSFLIIFLISEVFCNAKFALSEYVPNENLYIHTDKDIYFSGDRIFFKTYLNVDKDLSNALISKVLYIASYTPTGSMIDSIEVFSPNLFNHGSFLLPDTLKTGLYRLVGWTNNMLITNAPLFVKQIIVINRFDENPMETIGLFSQKPIEVIVEGGGLIHGIENQLAVLYHNHDLTEKYAYVVENVVDTIMSFEINNLGISTFSFTPEAKKDYSICIPMKDPVNIPSKNLENNLLLIRQSEGDQISVLVQTTKSIKNVFIKISLGNTVLKESNVDLNQSLNEFKFDTDKFPSGLLTISLLDSSKDLINEEFYVNGINSQSIGVSTDKDYYSTREKVSLIFNKSIFAAGFASASLSVTRDESLLGNNSPSINSYHELNKRENLYYVTNNTLNSFLIKDYSLIPSQQFQNLQYEMIIPENHGSILSGKVIDKTTKLPISNAVVFLSTEDTIVNLRYSETYQDGSFFFLMTDYYQNKNTYLSLYDPLKLYNAEIIIRNKFNPLPFTPNKVIVHNNLSHYIEDTKIIKRVQKSFGIDHLPQENHNLIVKHSIPTLYHTPSFRYKTLDYVSFENLSEIAYEIIPLLRIRKEKGKYTAKMVNSSTRGFFPQEPVIFLNGVYLSNINDIIHLSSKDIKSIDLISHSSILGNIEFNGILSIFSNEPTDIFFQKDHKKSVYFNTERGKVNFLSPIYDDKQKVDQYLPDLRETITWIPNLELIDGFPSNILFYTSDVVGNYSIIIEGIMINGKPFSQRIPLIVK